jgi:hypothetical protein
MSVTTLIHYRKEGNRDPHQREQALSEKSKAEFAEPVVDLFVRRAILTLR